jgi:hypothetical protein
VAIIAMAIMNSVPPKVAAKHRLLSNKLAFWAIGPT